jgi:serine/threonine protein kinase
MGENSGNLFPCPFCEQEHPLSAGFCPDTGRPLLPAHKVAGKTVESYFSVGQMIGEGAAGVVYGCENVTTRILFAAKFFKLNMNDPASMEAFKRYRRDAREAELTAHKNIAELAAVGVTPEGIPYEIMEFLKGAELGVLLEQIGRIPLRDAAGVAEQALEGLEAAHARGIVHGSLNPTSIFLAKRVKGPVAVKILDFGLVHILPHALRPPRPAHTLDTSARADYRPPEQKAGDAQRIDHRSDLFSMAVILFQAITGSHPFADSRDPAEALDAREIMPDLPAAVADFLGLGLAADREKRFQSASDMLADLRALDLEGLGRKSPNDGREDAAKQGEKPKKGSRGIGLPVREVVMHAHKDYSLSRRERIIRFDTGEKDGSGKAGSRKKGKSR